MLGVDTGTVRACGVFSGAGCLAQKGSPSPWGRGQEPGCQGSWCRVGGWDFDPEWGGP